VENLFLSGKSQGILKSDVCSNHDFVAEKALLDKVLGPKRVQRPLFFLCVSDMSRLLLNYGCKSLKKPKRGCSIKNLNEISAEWVVGTCMYVQAGFVQKY
jgi:hypothetical protein